MEPNPNEPPGGRSNERKPSISGQARFWLFMHFAGLLSSILATSAEVPRNSGLAVPHQLWEVLVLCAVGSMYVCPLGLIVCLQRCNIRASQRMLLICMGLGIVGTQFYALLPLVQ